MYLKKESQAPWIAVAFWLGPAYKKWVIYVDWALNSCLSVKVIKGSSLQYDFTLFDYSQLKSAG